MATRYAPVALALFLPAVLVYSSIRTFHELDQMKQVYLRNRTAGIAARLETMQGTAAEKRQMLLDDEPGLMDLELLDRGTTDGSIASLWNGSELFRTEIVNANGKALFRAYLPFHDAGEMRVARIDLDSSSADFLLIHARHNVVVASVSGGALLLLAGIALWSMRRETQQEKKRLELTHLAHVGKLSAVLAHEIRTPLATIKGFAQLALEQADDGQRPILQPVVREALRLERLVADLLLYGRPPQPAIAPCTWDDVTAQLDIDSGCGIVIQPGALRLQTDPALLRQILGNLIRNSCEALGCHTDGQVLVHAQAEKDDVVIHVDDNGPGIPEAEKNKVLESFYTTKAFGTGLGLPIANSLTKALGGSLSLQPRREGGLRASVRLRGALITQ